MALVYEATLRPTKLELLTTWLPGRTWYSGPAGEAEKVASFRFDDPAGEVGIETMLVRIGDGPVHQVPLTYRGAPLAGAEDRLLGTAEHSVLGRRWIYDGTGDPVYVAALASAILGSTGPAGEFSEVDGRLEPRAPTMTVASSAPGNATASAAGAIRRVADGDPTLIETDTVELTIVRRPEAGNGLPGIVLTGSWPGQETPIPLASATPRG